MRRSKFTAALAAAVITIVALAGCTGGAGDNEGSSGDAGAALTIAKPDGSIATESNNPYVGDSSAMKLGYVNAILEPLAIVNLDRPECRGEALARVRDRRGPTTTPSVALTARDGVTWNDGEAFSADDIAFTFQQFIDHPELDTLRPSASPRSRPKATPSPCRSRTRCS